MANFKHLMDENQELKPQLDPEFSKKLLLICGPPPVIKQTKPLTTRPIFATEHENKTIAHWTADERDMFLKLLPKYGKNWQGISDIIKSKTDKQVRNYFQNYKNKLNLRAMLPVEDK